MYECMFSRCATHVIFTMHQRILFIYIWIYIYVYFNTKIHIWMYIWILICIFLYIGIHIYSYIYTHIYIYILVYKHVHEYMYTHMMQRLSLSLRLAVAGMMFAAMALSSMPDSVRVSIVSPPSQKGMPHCIFVAVCCSVLQGGAIVIYECSCNTLQHPATHRIALHHMHCVAPYWNTLHYTATLCNTQQHSATRCTGNPAAIVYTSGACDFRLVLRVPKEVWCRICD